jgi:hypothetical protein
VPDGVGLLSALVGEELPIVGVLYSVEWLGGKIRSVRVVFVNSDGHVVGVDI